jgi:hypothetical protein
MKKRKKNNLLYTALRPFSPSTTGSSIREVFQPLEVVGE